MVICANSYLYLPWSQSTKKTWRGFRDPLFKQNKLKTEMPIVENVWYGRFWKGNWFFHSHWGRQTMSQFCGKMTKEALFETTKPKAKNEVEVNSENPSLWKEIEFQFESKIANEVLLPQLECPHKSYKPFSLTENLQTLDWKGPKIFFHNLPSITAIFILG